MNISLNGYGTGYVTLEAAEGLTEGVMAKISANRTAAAAGNDHECREHQGREHVLPKFLHRSSLFDDFKGNLFIAGAVEDIRTRIDVADLLAFEFFTVLFIQDDEAAPRRPIDDIAYFIAV